MKTIRSLSTLVGLSLVLFALGVTGAKAQDFTTTSFSGMLTLPAETHWGAITLPAGDYSLYYGELNGTPMAYVIGKAEGSPRGLIFAGAPDPTSAAKDSLICVRVGNSLVVRKLEMPVIGESVDFAMPHGMKLLAQEQKHGQYTLAEVSILIERVPVTLSQK